MTSQDFAATLSLMPVDDLKGFGAWLKEERERRGLSRAQVMDAGGPSISTQQNYEDGGRVWKGQWQDVAHTDRTLEQLAKGIGLDPDEVFRRAGRTRPGWAQGVPPGAAASSQELPDKISRLSPADREFIERLVDRALGEE